jgi:hypothetical protein
MMNPCIGMAWSYQFPTDFWTVVTSHMTWQQPCGASVQFWSRRCTANLDVVVAVFHGKPYTCAVDVKKDLAACSAAGHSRTSPMFKMLPSANVNLSSSSWNTRFSATISKFSPWALSFCRLNLQFTYCQVVTSPLFIDCVGETFDLRLKSSLFYEVFRQPQKSPISISGISKCSPTFKVKWCEM